MPARPGPHLDGQLDLAARRRRTFGDQLRFDPPRACAIAGASRSANRISSRRIMIDCGTGRTAAAQESRSRNGARFSASCSCRTLIRRFIGMRFARAIWKLLVGVKDALVLIFMLMFFGAALRRRSRPSRPRSAKAFSRWTSTEPVVEQPSQGRRLRSARGRRPGAGISPPRPRRSARQGRDRRPREGGRARPRRLRGRRPDGACPTSPTRSADVRDSGKPVLAYATGYTDDSYQLASAASEVWLNPLGLVGLAGPGGQQPLLSRACSTRWASLRTSIASAPTRRPSSRSRATTCRRRPSRTPRRLPMPCSKRWRESVAKGAAQGEGRSLHART